jgi:hypothetical protein
VAAASRACLLQVGRDAANLHAGLASLACCSKRHSNMLRLLLHTAADHCTVVSTAHQMLQQQHASTTHAQRRHCCAQHNLSRVNVALRCEFESTHRGALALFTRLLIHIFLCVAMLVAHAGIGRIYV